MCAPVLHEIIGIPECGNMVSDFRCIDRSMHGKQKMIKDSKSNLMTHIADQLQCHVRMDEDFNNAKKQRK
jgi:hypothetical protein